MSISTPSSEGILIVLTTVATQAEARALAGAMVEARLAACAQISAIESIYRWDGALQQENEWRVLLKTVPERYAALEAAIQARHPYELPAIVALPCTQALAPFADWVAAESRES